MGTTQRFLVELGGSQVDRIDEHELAEVVTRLVIAHEHGMGSLNVGVQEIPDGTFIQLIPVYDDFLDDPTMTSYVQKRPR